MTRSAIRSVRLRRTTAAALLPLAMATLVACGDSDGGGGTGAVSAAASGGPGSAETAEPGEEVDTEQLVSDVLEGFLDGGSAKVEMDMTTMGMDISADGVVDYAAGSPTTQMTMTNPFGGSDRIEARLVDGLIYLNAGAVSGGKFWRVDPADPDSPVGAQFVDQLDPRRAFEAMSEAVKSAVYVGKDDVDGAATDHYRLTVDSKKLMAVSGGGSGAAAMLPPEVTYELWLDEQDRVRKTTMAMGDVADSTIEISGWGEPVTVTAPPASEVTEMPKLDLADLGL